MRGISSCRDLEVWQFALPLAKEMYAITREFAKEKWYGMTSLIRRASDSAPADIAPTGTAEGYGRDQSGDYLRVPQIAPGSLKKFKSPLLLSCEIGIATQPVIEVTMALSTRIGRMLQPIQSRK
jgi:four helix bundle protein